MKQRIRALLLSAGFGTRLRPITLEVPKCLVPVAGIPMLARWLSKLEASGIEAVLINTHYLSRQVINFLDSWKSSTMDVVVSEEPTLLGTAGTLLANQAFFDGATGLLIHSDNLMLGSIPNFLAAHHTKPENCLLSMLTFTTDSPKSCGIVQTSTENILTNFYEKVDNPPGNLANAAIYAFERPFLDYLSLIDPSPSDFSTEVLPNLIGRIFCHQTFSPYIDIGTPLSLELANKLLSSTGETH